MGGRQGGIIFESRQRLAVVSLFQDAGVLLLAFRSMRLVVMPDSSGGGFHFNCPYCGARVAVSTGELGRQRGQVTCPACGRAVECLPEQIEFSVSAGKAGRLVALIVLVVIVVMIVLMLLIASLS